MKGESGLFSSERKKLIPRAPQGEARLGTDGLYFPQEPVGRFLSWQELAELLVQYGYRDEQGRWFPLDSGEDIVWGDQLIGKVGEEGEAVLSDD